jgi:WD40 repeat protein
VEDVELEHKYARDPGSSDALATTPEEQTVVQVNRNGYVLAWSPGKAESIKLPLTGVQARSRAVSPEGQVVAESSVDGTIVYGLDLASGKLSERFKHTGSGKAWCLALSSGGERLAAGFWDGTTRVYDVASSQVVFERKLLHTPTHVDLTADGQMLLVFTQRDGLRVIDLSTGEQRALWPPGSEMVRCVRFTSDGTRVIAGLNDRTARMWRVKDGRQLLLIEAGQSPQGIAWSEKQQLLATADGSVKLWKCRFDVAGSSDRPINDQ